MVQYLPGAPARMCVVAAIVQYRPLIVSDLVYLDDAPKGEDGKHRNEGTLEMIWRAVWGMLYADDARVALTSPRGLTRMVGVIVVACQEFGLTVSEKKTEAMHLWSHLHTASNALRIEAALQLKKTFVLYFTIILLNGINRRPSFCTIVVLSARARTLTSRLSVASAPLGRVSENTVPNCTTDGTPGCRSRSGCLTRS